MEERDNMLNAIKVKDEIITGGGVYAKVVKAADDLEEEDIKVYKKAKKLALGETIKFPSKKDDDFDEDEELD